jgi:hypothetical protein
MEAKIQKLVDFAVSVKDDPEFNRLTFPIEVLARLKAMGIEPKPKEYTASQAVDKCISIPTENIYTSNVIEVRDQTGLAIEFPKFPESASSTSTNETKTPESSGRSSPPAACDVSGNVLSF